MYINGLGTTHGETPTYTSPKKDLGRDEFLTLLITQLKNQNPLSPIESSDFTALFRML
jgi:flagellar basal-body rod modification protein FlgD